MKLKAFTRAAIAVIIFVILCILAAWLAPAEEKNPEKLVWYSIVPPVLAISLAFLTRHVLLSLGIAIIVGGFLTTVPQSPASATAWFGGFGSVGSFIASLVPRFSWTR